jgi:hypothetical protein
MFRVVKLTDISLGEANKSTIKRYFRYELRNGKRNSKVKIFSFLEEK